MRGHSSYTSWYFVERAEIGNINVNVTISLSSSILNTHAPGSVSLPENRGGLFSRVIGASGFQLINVNNVPLQLSGWSTDTKLIGRKALQSSLTRHYSYQGIREAHKVCHQMPSACLTMLVGLCWLHCALGWMLWLHCPNCANVLEASVTSQATVGSLLLDVFTC